MRLWHQILPQRTQVRAQPCLFTMQHSEGYLLAFRLIRSSIRQLHVVRSCILGVYVTQSSELTYITSPNPTLSDISSCPRNKRRAGFHMAGALHTASACGMGNHRWRCVLG